LKTTSTASIPKLISNYISIYNEFDPNWLVQLGLGGIVKNNKTNRIYHVSKPREKSFFPDVALLLNL